MSKITCQDRTDGPTDYYGGGSTIMEVTDIMEVDLVARDHEYLYEPVLYFDVIQRRYVSL